jgi:hypothetical protein
MGAGAAAQGALMMDVYATFVNGNPIAPTKTVTQALAVGSTVTVEVRAVVTGTDATKFQAIQSASGSILSTGGGMRGNLLDSAHFIQAPFLANSSSTGLSQDLDGDGDLDLGSNDNLNAANFVAYRANELLGPRSTTATGVSVWESGFAAFPTTAGTSHTYFTTTFADFVVTAVGDGATTLNFRPRLVSTAATWSENATEVITAIKGGNKITYSGGTLGDPLTQFTAGAPVVIGGGIVPEPASLGVLGLAGLFAARRRR